MASFGPTELFVSNFVGISEELGKLFSKHGSVQDFWVSQKKNGGLFGVVRMYTHEEALTAKKALNGSAFNGRSIFIKWAQNQRVLWVGQLGVGVTNQVLEDAFKQFGAIERAVVVSDAGTGLSRRFGFVTFDKKDDAAKALAMCNSELFLIGDSATPVIVELARVADVDEGYTEEDRQTEARKGRRGRGGVPGAAETPPARFVLPGNPEFATAVQLRDVHIHYREAKARLKAQRQEAEAALAAVGNASGMMGMQPGLGLPGPMAMGGRGAGPRVGAPNVAQEDFHRVAPPKRMRTGSGFDRRTPRHVDATFAPPPDLALGGSAAAPPVQSQGAFVRGGQLGLGTKEAAAAAEQQPPRQQQQPQQHRAPSAHYSSAPKKASAAPALPDKAADKDTAVVRAPGAKPPGSHDRGGIGLSSPSHHTAQQGTTAFSMAQGTPAVSAAAPAMRTSIGPSQGASAAYEQPPAPPSAMLAPPPDAYANGGGQGYGASAGQGYGADAGPGYSAHAGQGYGASAGMYSSQQARPPPWGPPPGGMMGGMGGGMGGMQQQMPPPQQPQQQWFGGNSYGMGGAGRGW